MATTTPNYGWTVPTSTDLVKDGATAIETLGDAIDASMNTALGTKKAGMVLLNTTSFSAVASQSISSVFNATYENYKLVFNFTNATNGATRIRLRSGSTDNTTNNYASQYEYHQTGGASSGRITDGFTSSWTTAQGGAAQRQNVDLFLFRPFATEMTFFSHNSMIQFAPDYYNVIGGGVQTESLSFDGFTVFTGANTITGSISVYGVNK